MRCKNPTLFQQLYEEVWEKLDDCWRDYLACVGFPKRALEKNADRAEVRRALTERFNIDFDYEGLEDLARETTRAIEPGDPARSLLYHMLASPFVRPSEDVKVYPTLRQIEIVENYVYGVDPPSIADLRTRVNDAPLAVVVFALEYCPARYTVMRRHADLCFSRTGISRVGTNPPNYMPRERGFMPTVEDSDTQVAVVPCRYAPFIAAQLSGNQATFGPARFKDGDDKLLFWVPLQKLFNGRCLDGYDGLEIEAEAHHVNEKLRRIHLALRAEKADSGVTNEELEKPPYQLRDGDIASFSSELCFGTNLLTPKPQPLIQTARRFCKEGGEILTFPVPAGHLAFSASLWFEPEKSEARRAPEFVHVKHQLNEEGKIVRVKEEEGNVMDNLVAGTNYRAVHFLDFTGDGWVSVSVPKLALEVPRSAAAYSIVAQPDFFPLIRQEDLLEWWQASVPQELQKNIWPDDDVTPDSLASSRLPANIGLERSGFTKDDVTVTAIVGPLRDATEQQTRLLPVTPKRESCLSFRSTSVFAPGWDVSQDQTAGVMHLAAYGLGSPFAEDAMLCAALGSFWPAAVPDTARSFPPSHPVVTPITDELQRTEWDKVPLPENVSEEKFFKYARLAAADYVELVWEKEDLSGNQMPFSRFAQVSLEEYTARTIAMTRVFEAVGAFNTDLRSRWAVPRFRKMKPGQALKAFLKDHTYLVDLFRPTRKVDVSPRESHLHYERLRHFMADPLKAVEVKYDEAQGRFERLEPEERL